MGQVNFKTQEELAAEQLANWRESAKVSRFQAREQLRRAGYLAQVNTLMEDPATDETTVMAWQDAQEFRRNSPTIAAMGAALGLTEEDMDSLFQAAALIEA